MPRHVSPQAFVAMIYKAVDLGQSPRRTLLQWSVDFSAGCFSPAYVTYTTCDLDLLSLLRSTVKVTVDTYREMRRRNSCSRHELKKGFRPPPTLYMDAQLACRRCEHCLRKRAALWRARAKVELAVSTRTWFATFTVAPEHRLRVDILRQRRIVTPQTDEEVFLHRHEVLRREFTLYWKRLRRKTRVPLRYLLVAEKHKDGWPHYHALVHERGPMVTKRDLQAEWKIGFSSFKLVDLEDRDVAGYVTKYIAKQALARIRPSLRYGTPFRPSEEVKITSQRDNMDTLTRPQEFRLVNSEVCEGTGAYLPEGF